MIIFSLMVLCTIFGITWGIFTGDWRPLSVPAVDVAFMLTPVYFSLYSNWLYALLTPVTLFFIVAFVQRNGFYTGSYITDLLLKGIVGLCFYGFIAESFNLYISWKDYCENNSGIYSLYNYKNFTEYSKKVTVYNWRAVVKKGRKDLLDGNP